MSNIVFEQEQLKSMLAPERRENRNWAFVKVLGAGSYGQVIEVLDRDTGEHYAVKLVYLQTIPPSAGQWIELGIGSLRTPYLSRFDQVFFPTEQDWHTWMSAPNPRGGFYVQVPAGSYYGPKIGPDSSPEKKSLVLALQMPLATTTLANMIWDGSIRDVTIGQKLKWAHELTCGLRQLWNLGIMHGDLKPGNILVFQNSEGGLSVQLTDFGLASFEEQPFNNYLGTPMYEAPEYFCLSRERKKQQRMPLDGRILNRSIDIFALAFTLAEVFYSGCGNNRMSVFHDAMSQSNKEFIHSPVLGLPPPDWTSQFCDITPPGARVQEQAAQQDFCLASKSVRNLSSVVYPPAASNADELLHRLTGEASEFRMTQNSVDKSEWSRDELLKLERIVGSFIALGLSYYPELRIQGFNQLTSLLDAAFGQCKPSMGSGGIMPVRSPQSQERIKRLAEALKSQIGSSLEKEQNPALRFLGLQDADAVARARVLYNAVIDRAAVATQLIVPLQPIPGQCSEELGDVLALYLSLSMMAPTAQLTRTSIFSPEFWTRVCGEAGFTCEPTTLLQCLKILFTSFKLRPSV